MVFHNNRFPGNPIINGHRTPTVRKISLVTGLSCNIRIHVFIMLARMEVAITYRAYGTTSVLHMLIYSTREGVTQSQDA